MLSSIPLQALIASCRFDLDQCWKVVAGNDLLMPYSLRWNNPKYWHRRAEEARIVVKSMSSIEGRAGLLRLPLTTRLWPNVPRNGLIYRQSQCIYR